MLARKLETNVEQTGSILDLCLNEFLASLPQNRVECQMRVNECRMSVNLVSNECQMSVNEC